MGGCGEWRVDGGGASWGVAGRELWVVCGWGGAVVNGGWLGAGRFVGCGTRVVGGSSLQS